MATGFVLSLAGKNMTIAGYEYRTRLEPSGDWSAPVDVGKVLTDAVSGLTSDTLYGFQVRDYDDLGNRGSWSNIATARTLAAFNAYGAIQWLKADHLSGLSDGDPITLWDDSSAFDNDGTSSGSLAPLYKVNIINSLPAARFNGTISTITRLDLSIDHSTPTTAAEMFIVLKVDNDPPN